MAEFGYDLLKVYYLCGSSNSIEAGVKLSEVVVICLKFTTFVVAATVKIKGEAHGSCCDLLKIYYLCGSSNSLIILYQRRSNVVICLKFTTFVVAATVLLLQRYTVISCDLLKIYYLCGSSNSESLW